MSQVVQYAQGHICGCCDQEIETEFAFIDDDLKCEVCPDCRMRLMFANGQLNFMGIKKCIQVSGNKPIL